VPVASPVSRPVLLYDGDCGFCTRSARLARRILPDNCAVAPWQETDLAALGTTEARAQREVLWFSRSGSVSGGARAIGRALMAAGFPWALLGVPLVLPPLSWVAGGVYRLVAANRMRLPGGTPACVLPPSSPAD
jgi:predicted DCC family thiol-disulfide oxidoreductase YuxK